jgi:hypothetical protein
MELELELPAAVPPAEAEAIRRAVQELSHGVTRDGRTYDSPWRRAALAEAVERLPDARPATPPTAPPGDDMPLARPRP